MRKLFCLRREEVADGEGVITWGHVVGVITEWGGGGGVVNCEICAGWNRCEQARIAASCEAYQIKCKATTSFYERHSNQ